MATSPLSGRAFCSLSCDDSVSPLPQEGLDETEIDGAWEWRRRSRQGQILLVCAPFRLSSRSLNALLDLGV